MTEGSGSGSKRLTMNPDPDPGGPKTNLFDGSGFRSGYTSLLTSDNFTQQPNFTVNTNKL